MTTPEDDIEAMLAEAKGLMDEVEAGFKGMREKQRQEERELGQKAIEIQESTAFTRLIEEDLEFASEVDRMARDERAEQAAERAQEAAWKAEDRKAGRK